MTRCAARRRGRELRAGHEIDRQRRDADGDGDHEEEEERGDEDERHGIRRFRAVIAAPGLRDDLNYPHPPEECDGSSTRGRAAEAPSAESGRADSAATGRGRPCPALVL